MCCGASLSCFYIWFFRVGQWIPESFNPLVRFSVAAQLLTSHSVSLVFTMTQAWLLRLFYIYCFCLYFWLKLFMMVSWVPVVLVYNWMVVRVLYTCINLPNILQSNSCIFFEIWCGLWTSDLRYTCVAAAFFTKYFLVHCSTYTITSGSTHVVLVLSMERG